MMVKLTKSTASLLLMACFQLAAFAQIKPTTADERLKSFERKKQLAAATNFKTAFKNIGPAAMSGRVVDVDVNPADPTEFYVAYATGGLWQAEIGPVFSIIGAFKNTNTTVRRTAAIGFAGAQPNGSCRPMNGHIAKAYYIVVVKNG